MREETYRAFIAVDLPEGIKNRIGGLADQIDMEGIRTVQEQQMHITMVFIGSVKESDTAKITEALSAVSCKPFEISVKGVSAITRERPRVIFAGLDRGANELSGMRRNIVEGLRNSGIKLYREHGAFQPHITIARVKGPQNLGKVSAFIDSHLNDEIGSFQCSEIKLKRSVLSGDGPEHYDVFTKRLEA